MATEDGANETESATIASSPNGTQTSGGGDSATANTSPTASAPTPAPKPAESTVNRQLFFARLRGITDRWKKAKGGAAGSW